MRTEYELHARTEDAGLNRLDKALYDVCEELSSQASFHGYREVVVHVLADGRVHVEVPYHPGYEAPVKLKSLHLDTEDVDTFRGAMVRTCQPAE